MAHSDSPQATRPLRRLYLPPAWLLAIAVAGWAGHSPAQSMREQVEADWLRQAAALSGAPQSHGPTAQGAVASAQDAAGAVDGLKTGKYGFHTTLEPNPWWQVDLGRPTAVQRIVVYNRLDYAPGLHNADNLLILASNDGKEWTKIYDHQGKHFGGTSGAKPLEVTFPPDGCRGRFIRLQIPSQKPIYFHLDEVEIYAADGPQNIARGRPADQSSVSQWSTAKVAPAAGPAPAPAVTTYPIKHFLDRGALLAADLRQAGVNTRPFEKELAEVAARLEKLPADAPADAQQELYLQSRWAVRRLALANPLLGFGKLLVCKRFTQDTYPDVCLNHMPWVSRPGGDICVVTLAGAEGGPQVRNVIDGQLGPGHVHGMDLWFDADRVVFGYAKAKSPEGPANRGRGANYELRRSEEPTHIFEIGIDGKNLRQLTDSREWSDLDPTYLPSGEVAFVSERCGYSLQCNELDKDETSCNLYVMRPDGSRIKRLSVTKDGDYLPHTLDDGTIGYTRWEYHERGWAHVQSLWVVHPDGTCADALFKQHLNEPWALEDLRSIPGSGNQRLLGVATGHHTLAMGPVVIVTPSDGMNTSRSIRIVTPGVKPPEGGMSGTPVDEGGVLDRGGLYCTAWPLSEKYFLASYTYSNSQTDSTGFAIYLIDVFGTKELLYRDPNISCFTPIPLRPRTRPPILPDMTDPAKPYAVCKAADVTYGVPGVEPRQARYIRIGEPLGWPYDNTHGGQRYEPDAKGAENWNPCRVLGTVPVEPDGSAHFQVPIDTAVYFQLLDENYMELRRMRSFISFQPGEVRGCVGCHETRENAPIDTRFPLATLRDPSIPAPPPWGDRPISFLRDVQPIFDRHCVGCHRGLKPAAGLDFFTGLTTKGGRTRNVAYDTLFAHKLVARSNVNDDARITAPLAFGSHKSKLVEVLRDGACSRRANLSREEWVRLVTWIDANGPYHDGFINKRPEEPPYDLPSDHNLAGAIEAVHARRCASCHAAADVSRLAWIDLREPQRTLFLAAPLAKAAGGSGKCGDPVYKDRSDADYQAVRQLVEAAVAKAWEFPRRDLKALVSEAKR